MTVEVVAEGGSAISEMGNVHGARCSRRACTTTQLSRNINHNRDVATSGSIASYLRGFMAARPVSELAKWDGRLDKQRQNSKWRRSSSRLARDPYHTPLENQSFGKLQPSSKSSDMRRAEQSTFRPNLEVRTFPHLCCRLSPTACPTA